MVFLRQAAAETARQQGRTLDEDVLRLLGSDDLEAVEGFWRRAEENLRSGRVRLVFVADEIPRELRRLVEFLNAHMPLVEVLTVEIRQYLGLSGKALVPRVIGLTEAARATKASCPARKQTTQAEFLGGCESAVAQFYGDLLTASVEGGCIVRWNEVGFSLRVRTRDDKLASFAYGYRDHFDIYFRDLPVESVAGLRETILATGVFKESGQYSLVAQLQCDNLAALTQVSQTLLSEIHRYPPIKSVAAETS